MKVKCTRWSVPTTSMPHDCGASGPDPEGPNSCTRENEPKTLVPGGHATFASTTFVGGCSDAAQLTLANATEKPDTPSVPSVPSWPAAPLVPLVPGTPCWFHVSGVSVDLHESLAVSMTLTLPVLFAMQPVITPPAPGI